MGSAGDLFIVFEVEFPEHVSDSDAKKLAQIFGKPTDAVMVRVRTRASLLECSLDRSHPGEERGRGVVGAPSGPEMVVGAVSLPD